LFFHRYLGAMSEIAKSPTISAVLTVYNKAPFLPETIRSLRSQADNERDVEYIFVYHASSDASVAVIKELMADEPNLRVIENADNCGPSIRLNQGAEAAAGDVLYFLDGDDIATIGAMSGMHRLLSVHEADLIYGKTAKALDPNIDLLSLAADPDAPIRLSERPLQMVLEGGFVRMALMCKRSLFLEAGGADERIFVQDESLPLRLAAKAKRMIAWQADVIAMPKAIDGSEKVSRNKDQLHHDAFLAFWHALDDFRSDHPDLAPALFAKAVSAYWKYARRQPGPAFLKPGFWRYLQVKTGTPIPRQEVLAWMQSDFAKLDNVRRIP
jgi:glycosyltransferase involved in cell wall biosynthesis